MTTRAPLDPLFAPTSVAVVGASDDPERAGGRLVRHLLSHGYAGRVHLVNPTRGTVAGRKCFPALADVPEAVDLVLLALGAARVPDAIREAGRCGAKAAVVFASGFAEAGPASEPQRKLADAWRGSGVRVLGPNTAGLRSTHLGLFAEQGRTLESEGFLTGSVAMISQSGALGAYFGSTYLLPLGVGTRYFVDTGNEMDIDAADCLVHVAADPMVSCIAILLESCRDGRKLASAVRSAIAANKAVTVLKVGRSAAGIEASRSHTAAMASQAELLEAELAAAGAFVTRDERQLADVMLLHAIGCVPRGPRLGVVTPSGGFGILALDLAFEHGLVVPPLEASGAVRLSDKVELRELRNPLEIPVQLSEPGTELLEATLRCMGSQEGVDAVVLWHPHRFVSSAEQQAHLPVFRRSREAAGKPIFHCGMTSPGYRVELQGAGVVSFETPSRLMLALAAVVGAARRPAGQEPRALARPAAAGRDGIAGTVLSNEAARERLTGWGIRFSPTVAVSDVRQVIELEQRWGRPVMLKLESRLASHKTEGGLVRGPLGGAVLRTTFDELALARQALGDPDAQLIAQPFEWGIELALGAYVDPSFGPSVMIAHGGIFVETLDDVAFAAAPVDVRRATELIASLRIYPALAGIRGRPADVPAAAESLVALSAFIAAAGGTCASVDINPLIVRELGSGAVAVDVRLVLPSEAGGAEAAH